MSNCICGGSKVINETDLNGVAVADPCYSCDKDALGQELDRWQLIARDLIELLYEYNPEGLPEYEFSIYQELLAMPEIHIRKDITEYEED